MTLRILVKSTVKVKSKLETSNSAITLLPGQRIELSAGDSAKILDRVDVRVFQKGTSLIIRTIKGEEYTLDNFFSDEASTQNQSLLWNNSAGEVKSVGSHSETYVAVTPPSPTSTLVGGTHFANSGGFSSGEGENSLEGGASKGTAPPSFGGTWGKVALLGLGAVGIAAAAGGGGGGGAGSGGAGSGGGSGGGTTTASLTYVQGNFLGGPVIANSGDKGVGTALQVIAYDDHGNILSDVNNQLLNTIAIDSSGKYAFSVKNYLGAITLKVVDTSAGPDFVNVAGGDKSLGNDDYRAITNLVASPQLTPQTININALTTLAANALKGETSASGTPTVTATQDTITSVNQNVSTTLLGLTATDITSVTPASTIVDNGNGRRPAAGDDTGKVLALISAAELLPNSQQSLAGTLAQLVSATTDKKLSQDAINFLIQAGAQIEVLGKNITGLAPSDVEAEFSRVFFSLNDGNDGWGTGTTIPTPVGFIIADKVALNNGATSTIKFIFNQEINPASFTLSNLVVAGATLTGLGPMVGDTTGKILTATLTPTAGANGVNVSFASGATAKFNNSTTATTFTGINNFSYILDNTPPATPVLALGSGITANNGASLQEAIANSGIITVQAEAGTLVTAVFSLGTNTLTKMVIANGTLPVGIVLTAADAATALGNGTVNVVVTASDAAGNISSPANLTFLLDTNIPATPGLALASDTGSSANDRITNNPTILVSGLEGGATWQYEVDGSTVWINGTGNAFTATTGLHSYAVRQTDFAGNISGSSQASLASYLYDNLPPSTTGISFAGATGAQNNTLNAGDVITIAVTMSEAASVTGTPQLAINIGNSTVYASYASGGGSGRLLFTYVILAGQVDSNGVSVPANAINLNGGTITDLAGNAASNLNTLALSDNSGYLVDTTIPGIVNIALSGATGISQQRLNVGDIVTVTASLSKAVTVMGQPQLALSIGGNTVQAIYASGSGSANLAFTYTILAGQNDSAGISIPQNSINYVKDSSIADVAGNALDITRAALNSNASYLVDTTPPVLNYAYTSTNGNQIILSYNEVLSNVLASTSSFIVRAGGSAIAVNTATVSGGMVTLTLATPVTSGQVVSITYNVPNDPVASNLAIQDLAGNDAPSLNGATVTNTVGDSTPPSVTVTTAAGRPIQSSSSAQVTSSEWGTAYLVKTSVTVSDLASITNAAANQRASVVITDPGANNPAALPASGLMDGTYKVYAVDLAGNLSQPSTASVIVDSTAPTVSRVAITAASQNSTGTAINNATLPVNGVVTATVTMSEVVNVNGIPQLGINLGGTANIGGITYFANYVSGSGSNMLVFTYLISSSGQTDTDGISLPSNSLQLKNGASIQDLALNNAVLSYSGVTDNTNFLVDTVAPTVSSVAITSATGAQNNYLNAGDVVTATLTLSKAALVTGIPQINLTVGSATKAASYLSGSGTNTLLFTYTIQGATGPQGAVVPGDGDTNGISIPVNAVQLNSGTITDLFGNPLTLNSSAVGDNSNYKVKTSASTPSLSLLQDTNFGNDGVTYNGAVNVNLGGETGSSWVYQVDGTTGSWINGIATGFNASSGTHTYYVQQTDLAGNTSPINSAIYTLDVTPPFVSSVVITPGATTPSNNTYTNGNVITFTVTMSEAVYLSSATPNLTLNINVGGTPRVASFKGATNNIVASQTSNLTGGDGVNVFTFTYVIQASDNDADGISIPAGQLNLGSGTTLQDKAGNYTPGALSFDTVPDNASFLVDGGAAPVFQFASTSATGDKILLFFNKALGAFFPSPQPGVTLTDAELATAKTNALKFFTLIGTAATLTDASVQGNVLSLTLSSPVAASSNFSVNYTAPTVLQSPYNYAIQGLWGNDASSFNQGVSNSVGDTTRPTASLTTTPITTNSKGAVTVTSDEEGTAYLVNTSVSVSNLSSITGAADNLWNSVLITHPAINTPLATSGLSDGTYKVYASDAVGNLSAAATGVVVISNTQAQVSSVALVGQTGAQNRYLNVGDTVTASVTFNGAVTVTGTPQLGLNIGGTARYANYVSGSGTNTLLFTYSIGSAGVTVTNGITVTIGAVDNDSAGIAIWQNSLILNGGTIRNTILNGPTNDAKLANPALGSNPLYLVDTAFPLTPLVSLASDTGANNSDGLTNNPTISVGYLESTASWRYQVDGTAGTWINGTSSSFMATSGTHTYYVQQTDLAGNTSAVSAPAIFNLDTSAPTVTLISISGATGINNKVLNTGDIVTFTVTTSEAVSISASASGNLPQLALMIGGNTVYAGYAQSDNTNKILSFTYTLVAGQVDSNGIAIPANSLNLNGATISDGAGNALVLTSPSQSANANYLVDTFSVLLGEVAIGSGGFVISGVNGLNGAIAGDQSGYSIAFAGDVNGDGFADMIVGAYAANSKAGVSYVVFGKANSSAVNLSAGGAGSGGFIINGQTGEQSGYSVSALGDINGDGFTDLLIGAPKADGGVGRSYVVFGKADGSAVNLSAVASGNGSSGGFVVYGENSNDNSGYSVRAAGDINNDGLADFIIGAPNSSGFAGKSYVVFGQVNLSNIQLSDIANGTGGFAIVGQLPSDRSGSSVSAAGDVNGDGFADVIVGAYDASTGAGRSYVVLGKADTTIVNLANVSNGTGGFNINGLSAEQSGWSVSAAGDVNGDGLADLIVGAPSASTGAGHSYVVFGKANLSNINLNSVVAGSGGFVINGQASSDNSGWSVSAAGDFNGDGLADLLVGAYNANAITGMDAGKSYLIFGKSDGAAVNLNNVMLGSGGFAILGENANDQSAWAVSAAGDINGDGFADLMVSAPPALNSAGKSYVIFGNAAAVSANSLLVRGNNTIVGSNANEVIVGGSGDDTLIGDGGIDRFFAGKGNDILIIGSNDIAYLANNTAGTPKAAIDGGTGIDTLRLLQGSGDLNLTAISNVSASTPQIKSRISSIERIDLATDTSANKLTLSVHDVLDMTGMNNFNTGNGWSNQVNDPFGSTVHRHQLVIDGTALDSVVSSGWTQVGKVLISIGDIPQSYIVYNSINGYAQLLVDSDIQQSGIVPA